VLAPGVLTRIVVRHTLAQAAMGAWAKVHDENKVRDEIRNGMKASEVWRRYGVLGV